MNVRYLNNRTCWEVYQILKKLGKAFIDKLPPEIYKEIKNKSEKNIDTKNIKISRNSIVVIAVLHSLYWIDTPEEKQELQTIFSQNEKKYQDEQKRKYDVDVFKKKKNRIHIQKNVNTVLIIPKKDKWYNKLWEKIRNILHI